MDYLHKPRRLIVTGRSGTGKTEFFVRYVKAVKQDYERVFIFDHEAEFADRTGEQTVTTSEELQAFANGDSRTRRIIQCYDYSQMYPGDLQTGLEFYADYCFSIAKAGTNGKSLFCCDEMQRLISTDDISHELACLTETGRRYRVDTVFLSQQVNLLHNRLRNQVTEVCTFQQNDSRAIKWLEEFGISEEEIRALGEHEFIDRNAFGGEHRGKLIFRGRSADPSGVTRLSERTEKGLDSAPSPVTLQADDTDQQKASADTELGSS